MIFKFVRCQIKWCLTHRTKTDCLDLEHCISTVPLYSSTIPVAPFFFLVLPSCSTTGSSMASMASREQPVPYHHPLFSSSVLSQQLELNTTHTIRRRSRLSFNSSLLLSSFSFLLVHDQHHISLVLLLLPRPSLPQLRLLQSNLTFFEEM